MTKESKWDINRVPTKGEKILGVVLSGVIFVFFTVTQVIVIHLHLREKSPIDSWASLFVSLTFFFGSLFLFYRVAFSKRQEPSMRAIRITAHVILSFCCAMIVIPFVVGFTTQGVYILAIGIFGAGGSKVLLSQGVEPENS